MVSEIIIPFWVIYILMYLIIGSMFSFASYKEDWGIEYDLSYIPLWPFYIFFWLPMIIFIGIGLLLYGLIVVVFRDKVIPRLRRYHSQYKYRKRVKKFKPKYGYDK